MSDIIASPSVRALAAQRGIDLVERAKALGRTTIGKEDLDMTESTPFTTDGDACRYWDIDHAAYGEIDVQPLGHIDKLAAANLGAAQTRIPAVTHHDMADVRKIESFRASLGHEAAFREIKLTALAFYVKMLAATLIKFPKFNASLTADGQSLVLKKYIHIGVAVDTPHGLMVPVIRDVDSLGIWEIAGKINDLAQRSQQRKIRPDEMGGASMTISSLGSIGGHGFSPIVNPPEVAILGLTRTQILTKWKNGTPIPVPMLPLDLSYDHRVINGADAARFCRHLVELVEDPDKLLFSFL